MRTRYCGPVAALLLLQLYGAGLAPADADALVRESNAKYKLLDPSYEREKEGPVITLENDRISLDMVTEDGGNVLSYHDKSGQLHPFQRLDDSFGDSGQWKSESCTSHIDERGPQRAAVTLTDTGLFTPTIHPGAPAASPVRLQVERTVSIDANSTRMHISVTVKNVDSLAAPDLRYMVHALHLQKFLPGPLFYVFMPTPGGVQCFDYERAIKGNYLARSAGPHHPFRAWSRSREELAKGRYAALGWLAMSSDSGHEHLYYDPRQFDFLNLWTGSHPAEWLVVEPNSKAVDLQPGQAFTIDFTFATDAADVPFGGKTQVIDAIAVPQNIVQGAPYEMSLRATTVLDHPETMTIRFQCFDAGGKPVTQRTLTAQLTPFQFMDIVSREVIPATLTPGAYSWSLTDTGGKQVANGRFNVLKAEKPAAKFAAPVNPTGIVAHRTNSLGMEFVGIPAGEFMMGSDDPQASEDERPRHRVVLTRGFWMGKFLVTNAQFRKFDPQFRIPEAQGPNLLHPLPLNADQQPAMPSGMAGEGNGFDDFCAWLNAHDTSKPAGWEYRLPTEAEWEYAARGPQGLKYPWGNEWDSRRCNFGDLAASDHYLATSPVGAFSPKGDSPFGVSDMAGNVWECCADYYDAGFYARSPMKDPVNTSSARDFAITLDGRTLPKTRVLRGGSWESSPAFCRTTARFGLFGVPTTNTGFRVVLAPMSSAVPTVAGK